MSEAGEAPRSLERLLARLAGEDAEGLLEEARTAARERVRAQLTDELARRMLHRIAGAAPDETVAAQTAAPVPGSKHERDPQPAGGTAVYVYAVLPPDAGTGDVPGGIGDRPVRVVEAEPGGLRALIGDVPLDEFGEEALKRNLNDLSWVSATAVAHEAVVEAAMAGGTLVPMRMCTIFRDEDGVREMLRREAATLREALERLRGASEWGLKVIADRDAFTAAVARESAPPGLAQKAAGEGAGYFAALRLEQSAREEVAAQLDRRTREIHEAVGALATGSRLQPPSNRELAGYEGDMVLNGAYLVPAARTDELRELVAALAGRHGPDGLHVELTGPWPPYNFSMPAGGL